MNVNIPVDRIEQGDCVDFVNALPDACVDLIFADPPYNLQLTGDLTRPDASAVDAVRDEWDQFTSFTEYDQFTRRWLVAVRRVLKDTGTLWVIGTYHNIHRVGSILMDLGYWILNDVVWVKHNPMPQMKGVRFCNAQETLIWAKRSEDATGYTFHYRELKSGNEDVQARSDWYIPLCTGEERIKINGARAHSTQKPEALLHRILTATTNPGDIVLDPFCGTGTTAAVARRLGRHYLTVDSCADYVDIARKRVAAVVPTPDLQTTVHVDAPRTRVRFRDLVEQGRLRVGQQLFLKGTAVIAFVNEDGNITVDGVKGSIHRMGARCLGITSCNGWGHWLYDDPVSGQRVPIDCLRPAPTPQAS